MLMVVGVMKDRSSLIYIAHIHFYFYRNVFGYKLVAVVIISLVNKLVSLFFIAFSKTLHKSNHSIILLIENVKELNKLFPLRIELFFV